VSDTPASGTALVTGASGGIGAVYASRLARRGHDLILMARDRARLEPLARRIAGDTGRRVDVLAADLGNPADLAVVERVLRDDPAISMLVNGAGVGATAPLLRSDVGATSRMIALNVDALTRLTYAAVPRFVARGTIVNIALIVAVAPELLNGVYGGTKAFVIALSQSLRHELAGTGVCMQVVLPGATATAFWSGRHPGRAFPRRDRDAGGRHGGRRPRGARPGRVRDGAVAAGRRGLGGLRSRAARPAPRPVPGDAGAPLRRRAPSPRHRRVSGARNAVAAAAPGSGQ
jgi:short-subunit dehydrogenase